MYISCPETFILNLFITFLPRNAMHSAVLVIVNLSVRLLVRECSALANLIIGSDGANVSIEGEMGVKSDGNNFNVVGQQN